MSVLNRFLFCTINSRTDPFSILSDTSITNNLDVRKMATSISGLITIIGVGGAVLSTMAYVILAVLENKNADKWAELKTALGSKLLLVAGLSCVTSICSFFKYVADSMVLGG